MTDALFEPILQVIDIKGFYPELEMRPCTDK